jgi:hypothetical protein
MRILKFWEAIKAKAWILLKDLRQNVLLKCNRRSSEEELQIGENMRSLLLGHTRIGKLTPEP